MTIEIKRHAGQTAIKIVGKLDSITALVLEKNIRENVSDSQDLVLDLTGLEAISDAGVCMLLEVQRKMQRLGSLRLTSVGDAVMDVLERTGAVHVLVIER